MNNLIIVLAILLSGSYTIREDKERDVYYISNAEHIDIPISPWALDHLKQAIAAQLHAITLWDNKDKQYAKGEFSIQGDLQMGNEELPPSAEELKNNI